MAAKVGRVAKIVALWKRGWNEIPEVMGSTLLAVIAAPLGVYFTIQNEKKQFYREFRTKYTIFRSDDPKLQKIPYNK